MDIDAERLRTAEIVTSRLIDAHGAGARSRRRPTAARRSTAPTTSSRRSRSAATSPRPSSTSRSPSATGCARRSPTRSASAGSCAACARSRCCSTSAATSRRSRPDALLLNYVNPMAMLCWAVAEASPDPDRRALPLRAAHGRRARRGPRAAGRRARLLVAGINHVAFFLRLEHEGEDLYPALREVTPPDWQPRPLQAARALRLLRHRVLRALRRVLAVVHQGRPRGPDRALQHAAGRVSAPLRAPDRRVGRRCATSSRAAASSAPSAAHEYGADIIRACETGEPFTLQRQRPEPPRRRAADRQPARPTAASRCRAWPAARRDRAAAGRRAPAPARRADADQHQRPGADRRGRADRPPRGGLPGGDARPAHGRRAVAGRDPRRSSTICSKPTATGSPTSSRPPRSSPEPARPRRRPPPPRRRVGRLGDGHFLRARRRSVEMQH